MIWGWGTNLDADAGLGLTIASVVVVALILVGIGLLAHGLFRHSWRESSPSGAKEGDSALAPPSMTTPREGNQALLVLEDRYARGEIEREEFLQRRADLLGDGEMRR